MDRVQRFVDQKGDLLQVEQIGRVPVWLDARRDTTTIGDTTPKLGYSGGREATFGGPVPRCAAKTLPQQI